MKIKQYWLFILAGLMVVTAGFVGGRHLGATHEDSIIFGVSILAFMIISCLAVFFINSNKIIKYKFQIGLAFCLIGLIGLIGKTPLIIPPTEHIANTMGIANTIFLVIGIIGVAVLWIAPGNHRT